MSNELSPENLSNSLSELERMAESFEKGYGGVSIENSGTVGSEGPKGGGQAGAKDVGPIDSLMIGKMIDSGLVMPTATMLGHMTAQDPAAFGGGLAAGYLKGFMHGKAGKEMNAGDGGDEEYMEGYKKGFLLGTGGDPFARSLDTIPAADRLEKSELDKMLEDDDIREGFDASNFMQSLVKSVGASLDEVRRDVSGSTSTQARVNNVMIKSIATMLKGLEGIGPVVRELGRRLDIVERTPATPRGATTLPQAHAMSKALPGEAGSPAQELSKAQIVGALSYMNLQKGIRQINGQSTGQLVAHAESGNIDESMIGAVRNFISSNPNEAAAALSYR